MTTIMKFVVEVAIVDGEIPSRAATAEAIEAVLEHGKCALGAFPTDAGNGRVAFFNVLQEELA